jgi:hypothetical protein
LQFGAIGQLGSIAFTERLIQTIKRDCTRRIVVPYRKGAVERELSLYCDWYNGERPHTSLDGATPGEIHDGVKPASKREQLGLRTRPTSGRATEATRARRSGRRNAEIELIVEYLDGRRHLPVVSLRSAA